VADHVFEQLTGAFGGKDLIGTLFTNSADRITGLLTFITNLVGAVATWLSNPTNVKMLVDTIVDIVTLIANSLDQILPPLINAIAAVLSSPELWNALAQVGETLLNALFGKEFVKGLKRLFGVEIPGEISQNRSEMMRLMWTSAVDNYIDALGDPDKEEEVAKKWDEFLQQTMRDAGANDQQIAAAMSQMRFEKLLGAMQGNNLEDFNTLFFDMIQMINQIGVESGSAATQVEDIGDKAEKVAGEYDIKFKISTEGIMPDVSTAIPSSTVRRPRSDSLPGQGTSPSSTVRKPRNDTLPYHDAKGEWIVPYDNYYTRLHRDEMVLTKSQARRYREGSADYSTVGTMVATAVEKAMSRVYVMMSGEKVGDLTSKRVRNNINAKSYSRLRSMGG
jgi:hypothetical protein